MTDQIEKDAAAEAEAAAAAAEEREAKTAEDSAPEQELDDPSEDDLSYLSEAERKQMDAEREAEEAEAAAAKAAEEEAAKAAEPEPKEEPAPAPAPEIPDTTEAERQAEDLAKQRQALLDKYEEGELTREDFRKQDDAIADQLVDARATLKAAADRRAEQEQADLVRWHSEVDGYLQANPILKDDPAHLRGFDQVLRNVTGSEAYAHLDWKKQIETAHKLYAVYADSVGNPIPMPGAAPAEPAKAAQEPKQMERRTDPRPTTPTLAHLPQSDPGGANESRFAGVDRLIEGDDPHAAEQALERMSDEERTRFLNGA